MHSSAGSTRYGFTVMQALTTRVLRAIASCAGRIDAPVAAATFLGLGLILLLAGCGARAQSAGPRVFYSIAAPMGTGAGSKVYVAAESSTPGNQPIAMTVLDPASGRALDSFPLSSVGALPCGLTSPKGDPVSFAVVDDRYIPFDRWTDAARGQTAPYRVRLYFRSDRGVIWETEVMARYSGCPAT